MKTCPVCQKVLTDQAKFCFYCGTSLLNPESNVIVSAPEPEPVEDPAPVEEPAPAPEPEPVPEPEPAPEPEPHKIIKIKFLLEIIFNLTNII